jgi:RNA polymerase sigma-70 factor, ECF subfamily
MIEGMDLTLLINGMTMAGTRERDGGLAVMGDDEFRSFYERTARPLWAYLSRITGSPQQADDLLQEAYYRMYRAGARHESEAHRRNSLFQIATNLVRDAARRAKHYEEVPIEVETPEGVATMTIEPPAVPGPENQAAARTDLARAMKKLEPVQRELLWLAYAEGASHEEIAEVLGLRTISVRTLLLRARRKLAGILTGGGGR